MIIRDAVIGDAAGVVAIWNPLIRDSVATFNSVEKNAADIAHEIATRQDAGFVYLVAENDGRIGGFATYGQFRGGIGYALTMEHTVHLLGDVQGTGMGRALMGALEIRAKSTGVHSLIGGISAENAAGLRFHKTMGYEVIATLPEVGFKFGRWFDLVLMQKIL